MNENPLSLNLDIKHLSSELRRLELRLKSETAPDPVPLNEFRHAVDNVRMTSWNVSVLINAEHIRKDPNTVLAFLSADRLRRFDQLVQGLCGDIERGLITVHTNGILSLSESVDILKQLLAQAARQTCPYKVEDAC